MDSTKRTLIAFSLLLIPCLFLLQYLSSIFAIAILDQGAFRDWRIFYDAGQAVRAGLSPFTVPEYYNPIQLAWFLQFTTWIPFPMWTTLMCMASFGLIFIIAKRVAPFYVLSLPFVFSMYLGMMDMFLWMPARLFGGAGLALLTLKPQLFALYAPFQLLAWARAGEWKEILRCGLSIAVLWGVPTLTNPSWIGEWLDALPTLASRLHGASFAGYAAVIGNIYFYYALFAVVMIVCLWKFRDAYYLPSAFSPSFSLVDHCINAEFATWRYTLLSWLLFPLGVGFNGAQQFFLLGILIFWEQRHTK